MKSLIAIGCVLWASLASAQDCPTKHAALTLLDHASMEAAYVASFRGLYHRDPTGVPGSGPDDTGYWIGSYDHYGAYSDTVCRAGWNAYTETRLSGAGSADPSLGDQPARFLPGAIVVAPTPVPGPLPAPVPSLPAIDYTALIQQLLVSQQQLLTAQSELLVVAKDTNTHVQNIDHTVAQTVGRVTLFVTKYIAPVVLGWFAAKKL